jgi:hypothetical protein
MKATSHQTVIYAGDGYAESCSKFARIPASLPDCPHRGRSMVAFSIFRLTRQEAAVIKMRAMVLDIQLQLSASEDIYGNDSATSGGVRLCRQSLCSQGITPDSLTWLQAPGTNSYN